MTGPASQPAAEPGRWQPSLEALALRGVSLNLVSYAGTRAISFVGTLVLARLLEPRDFGVVSTALVLVALVNLLSDTGLGVTLVARDDLDDRAIGTIFTCMVGCSVVLAGATAAAAGVLGALFHAPDLGRALPFLAANIVLNTISWFFLNLLQRDLLFARRLVAQFVGVGVYVGVAIPVAASGGGVWSLVAGQLASAVVATTLVWRITPYRVRPAFDLGAARDAYHQGRGFLAQSAAAFAGENAHYLAVASLLGPRTMGIFSAAYRLTEQPSRGLATAVAEATFPAVARMPERERRRHAFLETLRFVALAGLPIGTGLAALASPVVAALFGPRWSDMVPVLGVLAAWAPAALLASVVGWFLNATGDAAWLGWLRLRLIAFTIPAVFLAAGVFESASAVAAVLVVDAAAEAAVLLHRACRRLEVSGRELARALGPVVVGAAGFGVVAVASRLAAETAGVGPVGQLGLGLAGGSAAHLAALAALDRALLVRGFALLRRSTRRPTA